jgi:hypothetical protein
LNEKQKEEPTDSSFFILLCCKLLGNLSALGEMLIEGDDGLDAFVEVVEAVVLVG